MKKFNEIYNELRPKVEGYLKSKCNDEELAYDIASETMIKLLNNIDKFDDNIASMQSWVFSIAKNTLIDNWRKSTRTVDTFSIDQHSENFEIVSDNLNFLGSIDESPDKIVDTEELGLGIRYAIDELPKKYREVASLHFLSQMSYLEISDFLSIPMGTVKVKIFRSRNILQNKLEKLRLAYYG